MDDPENDSNWRKRYNRDEYRNYIEFFDESMCLRRIVVYSIHCRYLCARWHRTDTRPGTVLIERATRQMFVEVPSFLDSDDVRFLKENKDILRQNLKAGIVNDNIV